MIPVQLPGAVVCHIDARTALDEPVTRGMFVAAFTDVDPLGEQPGDDGDGVPLIVTDHGLRTPEQFCNDEARRLIEYRCAWFTPPAGPAAGGLLIPQPRLN